MASASGSGGSGGDRRYPANLQGLLQFATEHTKTEDARGAPTYAQMDPERQEWLAEVLASMSGTDPVKAMLEDIKVITTETDVEKQEAALDDLHEHCEDMDLATDFHKIGGYNLIEQLLCSEEEGLRWRAANLTAVCVQNNPYCQKMALEQKMLPKLLTILDTDSSATVRTKALYAVSCLSRDNHEAQKVFLECDGFSALLRAMQAEDERLQTKASFMLRAMILSDPKFKDTLCNIGMVEQFVGLLQREQHCSHEHLMGALLALTNEHSASVLECRRTELGLRKLLEAKLEQLKDHSEHQEQLEYCNQLMKLCFSENTGTVDR